LHETSVELPPLFDDDETLITHATDEDVCKRPYRRGLDGGLHEPCAQCSGDLLAALMHSRVIEIGRGKIRESD
jgi:hypothetical protein